MVILVMANPTNNIKEIDIITMETEDVIFNFSIRGVVTVSHSFLKNHSVRHSRADFRRLDVILVRS